MKKIISILFFIAALASSLPAQKLMLQVSKNKVAAGEPFQVTVSLNAGGNGLKIANLNEFDILQGPYNSSSTSIINGTVTQSYTLTYVIAAKKEGKYTLGPATVNSNGTSLTSNSVAVEAIKGAATQGQPNANAAPQVPSAPTTEDAAANLFVKTIVSKTKAYLGEQINITYKVYTRYQLRGFQDIKFSDYTGFFSQDVPMNQQFHVQNEVVDGINYQVTELKRSYLFAQRTGKLEIEPMKIECVVLKKSNKKARDIWEQVFGGGYEEVVYPVKSKAITMEIMPLPEENKPANFSGAVGEYSLKAELNKNKIKANESVNLTITLAGKGNIKLVDPLKIAFPEDFETYDPKTTENISVGANNVSGTKTFDYLIIPRHEGNYKIEQLSFSYFDPGKKEYVVLPSPDFTLQVEKGDAESAPVMGSSSRQEDLKVLGNDIRYIKTSSSKWKTKEKYFFNSAIFYLFLTLPFLAFFAFILLRRKTIEQNKDVIAVKSRKATKMARKRLSLAGKHLRSGNKELFYIEIFKALYGYIGDKLNIPVADLNKEYIAEKLKNRQVSENTILQLISTLDNCEYERYAPGAVSGDLQTIYNDTVALITKVEDEVS